MANDVDAEIAGAIRFLWVVLLLASCASIAGNVTHAVLAAPPGTVVLAAVAALVAPAVLLAATHTVSLLLRARSDNGITYWAALLMTLALAAAAFVLSFEALRSLAITVGIGGRIAWLWPVVIDVSIAQSTTALLSLTRTRHQRTRDSGAVEQPDSTLAGSPAAPRRPPMPASASSRAIGEDHPTSGGSVGIASSARQPALSRTDTTGASPPRREIPAGSVKLGIVGLDHKWEDLARQLVDEKRTRLPVQKVMRVLAMTAAGAKAGEICTELGIHHSAVRRIQDAADEVNEGSRSVSGVG